MEAIKFHPSYTVDDHEQWEGDWELWDGVPVSMSPSPKRPHHIATRNLLVMFQRQLLERKDCACEVFAEFDWRVTRKTVFRPDISIVCHEAEQTDYIEKAPTLAVEVLSESSYVRDREHKRRAYAQQGVRFYVIVDTFQRRVQPLELVRDAYVDGRLSFELHEGCVVRIDETELWRGAPKISRL